MTANDPHRAVRVLVVDDQPDIRFLLTTILGAAGYRARSACDAARATACLAEQPVDVVLCDLDLGADRGIDLLRTILASHSPPATVAVSGRTDAASVDEVLAAGVDGYVVKPFTPADIEMAVQRALHHRSGEPQRLPALAA